MIKIDPLKRRRDVKKIVISIAIVTCFLLHACSSAPKPKTVDGSRREPVNKTVMKDQMGVGDAKVDVK
jgi:starvation-inducible outer membrane lipoprotein